MDYAGIDGVESPMLFWVDDVCKLMQAVLTLSQKLPVATFLASFDACGLQYLGILWIARHMERILPAKGALCSTSLIRDGLEAEAERSSGVRWRRHREKSMRNVVLVTY